eukprot:343204-Pelagomonas_calceolata.AAC.4
MPNACLQNCGCANKSTEYQHHDLGAVHLLVDGISSQKEHDRAVALQRMANAGAHFLQTLWVILHKA